MADMVDKAELNMYAYDLCRVSPANIGLQWEHCWCSIRHTEPCHNMLAKAELILNQSQTSA